MPVVITKDKDAINLGATDLLPATKSKNGYAYKLLKRNKKAAIYSSTNEKFPEDDSVAYEVFKVVVSKPCAIMQKSGTKAGMWYQYPSTEKFPGNEDFGKIAWSYNTIGLAQKKFVEISK